MPQMYKRVVKVYVQDKKNTPAVVPNIRATCNLFGRPMRSKLSLSRSVNLKRNSPPVVLL